MRTLSGEVSRADVAPVREDDVSVSDGHCISVCPRVRTRPRSLISSTSHPVESNVCGSGSSRRRLSQSADPAVLAEKPRHSFTPGSHDRSVAEPGEPPLGPWRCQRAQAAWPRFQGRRLASSTIQRHWQPIRTSAELLLLPPKAAPRAALTKAALRATLHLSSIGNRFLGVMPKAYKAGQPRDPLPVPAIAKHGGVPTRRCNSERHIVIQSGFRIGFDHLEAVLVAHDPTPTLVGQCIGLVLFTAISLI